MSIEVNEKILDNMVNIQYESKDKSITDLMSTIASCHEGSIELFFLWSTDDVTHPPLSLKEPNSHNPVHCDH
ncbi:hypothetical protein IRJ41_016130 [Triplophysa rosa]|uniref:Uncharacterized protein n=1 Tax=Triplophysa rosa TaxID=992332 RepID=A0A9W7TKU1_TRIRA|nr:hypothetical protein IRJ41_016130 [Triplophysa rosa]